ncbi:peptidoglycan-binding protein [Patescibacteria group bacterium]|nr:peptidoglycan-binding protein [Patescibacteria group bacterium]
MKKFIVSLSMGVLLVVPVFAFADTATDQLIAQLQAQIVVLQAQINILLQQQQSLRMPVVPMTVGGGTGAVAIKNNIGFGSRGLDVEALQNALKNAGVYSGPVTGYFGALTREAVKSFQVSHSIPSTGFVGTLTRNFLSTVISPTHQVCTQEAKQCPDGSSVARTGLNCEFAACPGGGGSATSSLAVISPNGGEQWQKGTTQTIKWSAPASVSAVSISLEPWIACLHGTPTCEIAIRPYTLAASTQNDGVFEWTVGKDASGNDIPAGQYTVSIMAADGSVVDSSDAPFSVVASSTIVAPTISSLQPTSGSVHTPVIITGSGFTATGNKVKFGNLGSENDPAFSLNSSDGKTLVFTVPSSNYLSCWSATPRCLAPAMMTQPGLYAVSVMNANGMSNAAQFSVITATVATTTVSALGKYEPQDGKSYFGFTFRLWDSADPAYGDTRHLSQRLQDSISVELGGKSPTLLSVPGIWQQADGTPVPFNDALAAIASFENFNGKTIVPYIGFSPQTGWANDSPNYQGITTKTVAQGALDSYIH